MQIEYGSIIEWVFKQHDDWQKYRIGTRGSPLALAQAYETRDRLLAAHPDQLREENLEIVVIKTTGDRIQDRALSEAGGKGLFVKEIEEAMLRGDIDLAVHSMKDMETTLPDGLIIDCICLGKMPVMCLSREVARLWTNYPQVL